jgi:protein-S-isoprenylcysteine O-methyltransferase Ste14
MSEETVVLIASLLWAFSEVVGGYVIPRFRQKGVVKTRCDRGSRLVIWLSIFVSISIVYYFGTNGVMPLPDSFLYIGVGVMAVGIAFRQWAILVLGRFFSTTVRIVSGQKIVSSGPYRVVRHPSYTGSLLTIFGLGLASRTWGGTLIILILFGLAFNYRINVEEKALKTEFGQAYVDYAKKTKRLVPFLL